MKKITRLLSLVLAVLMLGTCLVGCGSTETKTPATEAKTEAPADNKEEPKAEEEAAEKFDCTLNIMFPGDAPPALDEVNKAITAKMEADGLGHIELNYTFVPWDQYWNKLSMVRAAEEDYDIMWQHVTNIPAAVKDYLVAPLNDSLEKYGQDLLAYIPESAFKQSTFDGQIYSIPRVVPNAQYDWALSIRGDLRKKYGMDEITTLEQLEEYFQAVQDNEPGMVPAYVPFREAFYRTYIPTWYLPVGMNECVSIDLTDPDFTVKSFYESEEFAAMAAKSEEYRQKGYYYADYDPGRVAENEFMAGKMASCFGNAMWPTERIDTLTANIPGAEIETVFLNPDVPKYMTNSEDNLLSVFEHSKKVDAAVAFINWVHASQENYDLFSYGIEGENYNLVGESVSLEGIAPEKLYQPISWAWTDLRYNRYPATLDPAYVDVINHWDDNAVVSELLGFAVDVEPIKNELTNIATVYDTYIKPVTMQGTAAFDRDTVSAELQKAGIETVVAEVQRQVDAYLGK